MSTQTNLFAPLGVDTAPEKSRPLLEKIQRSFKFIPNLFGVFANSPVLLEGYMGLEATFEKGSLSAVERQIVLLAASVENSCKYCTAAHSTVLKAFLHVPPDVVSAVRSNVPVSDRKLNALVALTKLPADKIMPQDIEAKLTETATDREWAPATRNRYRATLSLAYRLGIKAGKVTSNPAKGVTHQKEDNQVVRWLTDDEEKRLKAAINPKDPMRWAAVLFSINTGMRAGEQWGLTWGDINLRTKQATLPTTKNGTIRYVPLNQHGLDALAVMQDRPQPEGRVFHQQNHRQWFEHALKRAKIEGYHWHCNRHTTATRLVKAGVPLHVVAAILGHKGLDMVLRYAHFAPDYLADAVGKLVVSTPVSTAA